jgi:hypothetical protein
VVKKLNLGVERPEEAKLKYNLMTYLPHKIKERVKDQIKLPKNFLPRRERYHQAQRKKTHLTINIRTSNNRNNSVKRTNRKMKKINRTNQATLN